MTLNNNIESSFKCINNLVNNFDFKWLILVGLILQLFDIRIKVFSCNFKIFTVITDLLHLFHILQNCFVSCNWLLQILFIFVFLYLDCFCKLATPNYYLAVYFILKLFEILRHHTIMYKLNPVIWFNYCSDFLYHRDRFFLNIKYILARINTLFVFSDYRSDCIFSHLYRYH